jgi:hypothetical protein
LRVNRYKGTSECKRCGGEMNYVHERKEFCSPLCAMNYKNNGKQKNGITLPFIPDNLFVKPKYKRKSWATISMGVKSNDE